jgi:hypothetical protein
VAPRLDEVIKLGNLIQYHERLRTMFFTTVAPAGPDHPGPPETCRANWSQPRKQHCYEFMFRPSQQHFSD